MNFENFLAKRMVFGHAPHRTSARPAVKVAIAGIALSIAVMLLSVMIVSGFKNSIIQKTIGFASHIRITKFDNNNSIEEEPINRNEPFYGELEKDERVKKIYPFATKAGIIKTGSEVHGVILKGIDSSFDWSFFADKFRSGHADINSADSLQGKIIISAKTASLLNLKTGDFLVIYFIQQPARVRKLLISGIYETGLEEFDKLYAFCNLKLIQKLNDWDSSQVSGFEITLKDSHRMNEMNDLVNLKTGFQYKSETVRELYPQIFNWLDLLNINAVIIIVLMVVIAGINLIATLLILILENTRTIGILKSLGASGFSIRKIFIWMAGYVAVIGLGAGNAVALLLAWLQSKFGLFTLPEESYYVPVVPIEFSMLKIILLNAGTLAVCLLMLIWPSSVIARIKPVKVLRFD